MNLHDRKNKNAQNIRGKERKLGNDNNKTRKERNILTKSEKLVEDHMYLWM
jgi:hypothetical protein